MVVGVGIPAELFHVLDERGHDVEVAVQGPQVVAGFLEQVERVIGLVAAARVLLKQKKLRLDAGLQDIALLACPLQLALENSARAIGPRLAVDVDVRPYPGHVLAPRKLHQAGVVGHGDEVRIVRALAAVADREARKASAPFGHILEVPRRHELGLRHASHLDKRAEEKLDAPVLNELRYRLEIRHGYLSPPRRRSEEWGAD